MATSSSPKGEELLLSGQTDVEIRGRKTPREEGRHACAQAEAPRTHPQLARDFKHYTLWPEQEVVYERLRPIVLFGETAADRAKETGASERTLHYQARLFEQEGMASLFHKERQYAAPGRNLPPEMCQLIVNLKAEYPGFSLREISTICFLDFGRNSPTTPSNEC